ncbi:MAG TPA: DUF2336 domain-containing protein [Ferrovibrio sp.]|uniref:DUF2336 domain-containing protein n=1 Tax=Ferrovibrio sp. TaxID=1917215 RepID=UPI002B4B486B|nr:DUF2336 domain-containing protein [Ferrovibrio sp.]HLT77954.1 DUF2336 domain-containing protein [Ferrovibrio sp.]
MAQGAFLSIQDVERLLADPSPAARADTAAKVARAYSVPSLSDSERQLAQAIVAALSRDAELRVRQALAEHIADNPDLPPAIAARMARDVAAVAVPVLRRSPVFTDAELIELLQSVSPQHQAAIAGRARVSSELCGALVSHGAEPAVAVLMGNRGAPVSEPMMERALDRFPDSRALGEALARRPGVPAKFAARLVALVAEDLRETLIARYRIPPAMAADMMLQLRERSLLGLLGEGAAPPALAGLVADLQRQGQLSPGLVLRALAGGDIVFFEQALAQLCSVPLRNAQLLIHDPGGRGFRAIYDRAGLPGEFFAMAAAVVEMARGQQSGADRAFFVEAVTTRLLAEFSHLWDGQDLRWLERRRARAQTAQRIAA